MTIQVRLIKEILKEPYDFQRIAKNELNLKMLSSLDVEELILLKDTLKHFIPDVRFLQTKAKIQEMRKLDFKDEVLKKVLIENNVSIDELEEFIQRENKTKRKITNKKKALESEVIQYEIFFDGRHSRTIAGKVLPIKLKNSKSYIELINKQPEYKNVDLFLRTYSAMFREKFPINAQYKSRDFHCNLTGRFNLEAQNAYNDWLIEHKNGDQVNFKKTVLLK